MNNTMQSQLSQIPQDELHRLAESFGKYTTLQEERPLSTEEATKRERARLANKIYRKVCNDTGLDKCFFMNFATWSDYVTGRMSESEFLERSKIEAERMKVSSD